MDSDSDTGASHDDDEPGVTSHVNRVVRQLVDGRRAFITSAFTKFGNAPELWVCGADAWFRGPAVVEEVKQMLKYEMSSEMAAIVTTKDADAVINKLKNLAMPNKEAPIPAVRTLLAADLTTMRNNARRHIILPGFVGIDLKQGDPAEVKLGPADTLVLHDEIVHMANPEMLPGEDTELLTFLKTTYKNWRILIHLVVRTLRGEAHKHTAVLYSIERDAYKGFFIYLLNLLLGKTLCPVAVDPCFGSKAFESTSDTSGAKRTALVKDGRSIIRHLDDRNAGNATVAYGALKQQQSSAGKLWISGTTESIGAMVAPMMIVSTNCDPCTIFADKDQTATDKILVFEVRPTDESRAAFDNLKKMMDTADGKLRVRYQLLRLLLGAVIEEEPDYKKASLRKWTEKNGARAYTETRAPAGETPGRQARVITFLESDKANRIYHAGKGSFLLRSDIFRATGVDFTSGGKGVAKKMDIYILKRFNVHPSKRSSWGYLGLALA